MDVEISPFSIGTTMFPFPRNSDSNSINRKPMEELPTSKTGIYPLRVHMKKVTIGEHPLVMEEKQTSPSRKDMGLVSGGINCQVYGIDIDNFKNKDLMVLSLFIIIFVSFHLVYNLVEEI